MNEVHPPRFLCVDYFNLCGERFPEPAGPAAAGQPAGSVDCVVNQADKSAFIYIDVVADTGKTLIAGIQIGSHWYSPPEPIIILAGRLCNIKWSAISPH